MEDLKRFNEACQDFLAGKYILANLKLKALINTINGSEKLTDIVSSSLDGFDFNTSFRNSVSQNGLFLPEGDKNVIAYCFNIIYNLDAGTITFLDFLNKYFGATELTGGEEFKLFANTIIKPFQDAINSRYNEIYVLNESKDYQENIYHKLINVSKINIDNISNLRLKEIEQEELELLLNGLITASENCDKKLVYALMVGLEYFVKSNKKARAVYLQLKDCFERN